MRLSGRSTLLRYVAGGYCLHNEWWNGKLTDRERRHYRTDTLPLSRAAAMLWYGVHSSALTYRAAHMLACALRVRFGDMGKGVLF